MNNDKHEIKIPTRTKRPNELGPNQRSMDQTKGMTKDLSESNQMKWIQASCELGTRHEDDPEERLWKEMGWMKVVGPRNQTMINGHKQGEGNQSQKVNKKLLNAI